MDRVRSTLGWIGQVLAWLIILGVAAALVAAVLLPRVAGATPYTVLTSSMRPSYPPGTLVVVKPVEFQRIATGDVITYQLESGKPAVVTHRVVKVSVALTGERRIVTQGDANGVADAAPVRAEQVRGKVWYSLPYLGHVNNALTGSQRQIATYGVAGLLGLYAGYMLIGSLRDRRKEHQDSSKEVTS